MRTLLLTSPHMKGEDVLAVQKRLPTPDDGEYGPATASAVAKWKWYVGYPTAEINNGLGPRGQRLLLQLDPLPADYRERAVARQAAARAQAARNVPARAAKLMETWAAAGWKEQPAGTNKVPQLAALCDKLGLDSRYGNMGYAWCELAASVAALAVGGTSAKLTLAKWWYGLYTPDSVRWAREGRFGTRLIPVADLQYGDKVYFDFDGGGVDHVGRFLRWSGGRIVSVDGNTSASGSQNNGGAMLVRDRPKALVVCGVRDQ